MSGVYRSPIYEPIRTPSQQREEQPKAKKPVSPLSGYIQKDDMILIWTAAAIVILVLGVFFYYNYGPGSLEEMETDEHTDVIDPVTDVEST